MKTKTVLSLLCLTLLVGLSACDVLDVEPKQSLDSGQVFDTPASAEAALTGAYGQLQSGDALAGHPIMMADFTVDNAVFSGSFTTYQDIQRFDIQATNGAIESAWEALYEAIDAANNVIAQAAEVPGIADSTAARLEGEARFIRAISYFYLINYWAEPYTRNPDALGVPLVTEPTETFGDQNNVPRSTVAEVYSQMVTDLTTAVGLVPATFDTNLRGRGSQGAIRALLSRVYLYQADWGNAATQASQVIDSGSYTLQADFGFFDVLGSEIIYAVLNSGEDNPGVNDALPAFYLPGDLGGRGELNPSPDLLDTFDEGDLRGVGGLIYEFQDQLWTDKYNQADNSDFIPILRVGEMYLNRAEARYESGNEAGALEDLNAIRNRAGLDDFEGTGEALLNEILRQRRLELAFEGQRRFDLLRRGMSFTNLANPTVGDISFYDDRLIWPIPAYELDVNPALQGQQNPGY